MDGKRLLSRQFASVITICRDTEAERYELLALLQIYQLGELRRSEALAEAVQRGLRSLCGSPLG